MPTSDEPTPLARTSAATTSSAARPREALEECEGGPTSRATRAKSDPPVAAMARAGASAHIP